MKVVSQARKQRCKAESSGRKLDGGTHKVSLPVPQAQMLRKQTTSKPRLADSDKSLAIAMGAPHIGSIIAFRLLLRAK
jgi:hypothetical protein